MYLNREVEVMNSLVIKALLGLSLMGKFPVESVVISIDKYQTPDLDTVYLLGDVHIGSPALISQEQIDFMAAVKNKKNVYVVAEDMSYYSGNNQAVRELIHAKFKEFDREASALPHEIIKNSALNNIAGSCKSYSIPFFNAECRHEVVYRTPMFDRKKSYDSLAATLVPLINNLTQYRIHWLRDYCREHIGIDWEEHNAGSELVPRNIFYDGYFFPSFESQGQKDTDFLSKAVDIHILYALHDITHNNARTLDLEVSSILYDAIKWIMPKPLSFVESKINRGGRNIFVFAGLKHIGHIIPTLKKDFKYVRSSTRGKKKFSSARFAIDGLGVNDQREFIDTYGVNITDFFAQEEDQEKQESCE